MQDIVRSLADITGSLGDSCLSGKAAGG